MLEQSLTRTIPIGKTLCHGESAGQNSIPQGCGEGAKTVTRLARITNESTGLVVPSPAGAMGWPDPALRRVPVAVPASSIQLT